MKSHARAVVIGGGVVGVSTLYHLVKKGWSDVMLIERKELTSGSTWHAAGLLPLFNMSYSVGQIHKYSVNLYKSLQAETGQDVGIRAVSNIRLADNEARMDEYRYYAGVAETIGVDVRFLTPEQLKEAWPLCNTDGIIGAIQHPDDGYVQPADLTQAFAIGARAGGGEINRNTTVTGIEKLPSGEWLVRTDKGDVTCEHLITATGNFARRTGAMLGIDMPVIPVEHQFIVTEAHPDILARQKSGLPEMGVLRESDHSWYMREEAGGLLLGPYEKGAPCCYLDGPDEHSEYELFEGDLDRLEPHIEAAMNRVPAFGEAGVKKVYNGAICYTPDGSPIIGPAWQHKNLWLNEGHSFGITAAGGAGWQLAEWIVEGEPTIDMTGVDPRRYGPYAARGYLKSKNEEAYASVFVIHYPDEERPAARPLKTAPCYDRMKALGAVFGQVYGWERPNWFAPKGVEAKDVWSFRRANYFEHVMNEVRHVSEHVGVLDMSAFSKFMVTGSGASNWLNSIMANTAPGKKGRMVLAHLLTTRGGVRCEFTIYKIADNHFYLVSAGAYERHDGDVLNKLCPDDGSVNVQTVTTQYGVLVLAGPKSRDVLQKLTDTSLAHKDFPWLSGQSINVGYAQANALRVNFVGELGWELHHPIEMQNSIFDSLMDAGAEYQIKPFGIRAMDSMRLEKSYRLIPRELSIEYCALESGLERFVKLDKSVDFIGKQAVIDWQQRGFDNAFVTMEVQGTTEFDARGSEPIYLNGELVGRCTSGGYGARINKSLALAMVQPKLATEGTELQVKILGEMFKATVIAESPFDPTNERLRS
ncbi:MAG: FAD-dependent oxidoreductase [Granulosicoccus sp.]